MQQFEDLMNAAAASGPAGSPLPLYYAMSQAGRAILAAREPDFDRVVCFHEHHGLTVRHEDVTDDVFAVTVRALERDGGLFQRVAKVTGSEVVAHEASLGALGASLPDAGDEGWNDTRWPAATPLYPVFVSLAEGTVVDRDDRAREAAIFKSGVLQVALVTSEVTTPEDVHDFSQKYPTIAERNARLPMLLNGRPSRREVATPSGTAVVVELDVEPGSINLSDDHAAVLDAIAPLYRWAGRRWIRPSVESGLLPPSPLMTWWALLFGLSALARYHPVHWTRALELDRSSSAAVLQRVLVLAQDAVPHLVFEALRLAGPEPLLLPPGTDTPPVSR